MTMEANIPVNQNCLIIAAGSGTSHCAKKKTYWQLIFINKAKMELNKINLNHERKINTFLFLLIKLKWNKIE